MTVEAGVQTIADLDSQLPDKGDYISEGDDHIKLIKHSLQSTFKDVDVPLTAPFSSLNGMAEYMEFKTTPSSTNSQREVHFKQPTIITNMLSGSADSDVASIGKVKELITNVLLNTVYRLGSYYISDNPMSEADVNQVLGLPANVRWERVVGFLGGVGTAPGALGEVNSISPGNNGTSSVALTAAQMPLQGVNLSGVSTSSYSHSHNTMAENFRVSEDDKRHLIPSTDASRNNNAVPTSTDTHSHSLTGSATVGNPVPAPVNILPTYRGVYIFRRTA